MTILSKTLLTVAVGGLTLGSIVAHYGDDAGPVALTAVLPLGAVAFGLFLIVFALEKEVASYDREQAMKGPALQCDTAPAPMRRDVRLQPITVSTREKAI